MADPQPASSAGVKLQTVKYAPPPAELPVLGKVDTAETSFIGKTNYVAALEEKKYVFGIKRVDRRRNVYIIGKSGTGKTKLMELMIRQDISAGRGVCLFDQHGDLINDILDFIPESRAEDVLVIDPSDIECPVAFNPLSGIEPAFRHQFAQGLIEILESQFGSSWNAHIEHVFRFIVLALLDYPQATMRGMISMLTDAAYRAEVIPHITDEMVQRFWRDEFVAWSTKTEKVEAEAVAPLVNKLAQFFSDPLLRSIFTKRENAIDVNDWLKNQKIVLINLNKGKLGKENSSFFGGLFLIKLKQAGMARLSLPEATRKDFNVYVDEFHHLITETFENLLFEGKKYHISFTISHQYLGQIIEHFRSSIFGNVGTIIVFRIGGEDAERLESELAPVFKVKDMINLGKREFYIKMVIDGEPCDPFSAETLKVLSPNTPSAREKIMKTFRGRYCHPAVSQPVQPIPGAPSVQL